MVFSKGRVNFIQLVSKTFFREPYKTLVTKGLQKKKPYEIKMELTVEAGF